MPKEAAETRGRPWRAEGTGIKVSGRLAPAKIVFNVSTFNSTSSLKVNCHSLDASRFSKW